MRQKRHFADVSRLGLFGARPVVFHKRRHWLDAQRLFTVHPDRLPGRGDDFVARRLGARLNPRSRDRLYVSRNLAAGTNRGLSNDAEMISALTARGFEIVDPGAWSIEEQIKRFAAASVVVGPHGSGLTNIIFRAGAPLAVVEIISSSKVWRHHFYELSCHFEYFCRAVLGASTDPTDEQAPFDADVDAALAAVDEALSWEGRQYSP